MFEFIENYAPQIILGLSIIGTAAPLIRKRIISDKNMMNVFGNIKDLASKVKFKEVDINKALLKVDVVQKDIQKTIDNYQQQFNEKMKLVDKKITDFMESDLYQKMLNGLNQLDQLMQILDNKNATIQELGETIKSINQKFLEIKNKLE